MKAPRLQEVTARVVAWHNRHPLARRIEATQVHSIGEVQLPFASAQPWSAGPLPPAPAAEANAAPVAPTGPSLAQALAQRVARQQAAPTEAASTTDIGSDGQDLQSPPPAADAPPPSADIDLALDAADDDAGEAALVIPLLDGDDAHPPGDAATAQAGAQPAPAPSPDPATLPAAQQHADAGGAPASALARAVERRAAARATSGPGADGVDPGSVAAAATSATPSPPPSSPGRWRRLADVLRRTVSGRQPGLPVLRAAFSRDFIWPLRPSQVARWAQRHGQPQPLAPADWPQRCIAPDRARLARLRQQGLAHDLPLHVLTAAIGVGDRRIRVLVAADGSIIGPRAYQRSRVGSASLLLALGLLGAGWSLRPAHGPAGDAGAAALIAAAASAAASTPLVTAAPDLAASASVLADAASAADSGTAAAPQASPAEAAASSAASGHTETTAAAAADPAASQPQASIRPALSDEQKQAARAEAARLRGEPTPQPPADLLPGPVYAVVSPPSRQRDAAAGSLVLMKAAASRLNGAVPEHGELLESQGQWRAAWWPFASLVDAERARVLLAGRGLKAEVIEF